MMTQRNNRVRPDPISVRVVDRQDWHQRLCRIVATLLLGGMLAACGPSQQAANPGQNATAAPPVVTEPAAAGGEVAPTQDATGAEGAPMTAEGAEPTEIGLAELYADPGVYLGQQVIITGDLREVFGPRSFALNDPDEAGVDSALVLGAEEGVIPSDFEPNIDLTAQVRVIGTVREFDRSILEQELGFQLPVALAEGSAGVPAIIASEVELIGEAQGAQPTTGAAQGARPTAAAGGDTGMAAQIPEAARGDFPFVSVGQIDVDPEAYIGQRVTAWGEVDEQLGPNTFRVDEGNILDVAGDLLVVVPEGAPRPDNLQNETSIAITGMVQQFVSADFERDYGVLFDDPGIEAEFESRPVLVADIVYTRASVSDVDDDAEAYLGNRVTVLGDITEQLDARTFRLDDPALLGGDDVLVLMRDEAMSVAEDARYYVTGTVQRFNLADAEAELGYEFDDTLFSGWGDRTVVIVDSVQARAVATTAQGRS